MRLETFPITARSFEKDYHIDGDEFGRAYKEHISGYRTWTELEHADEWLIFPENIGPHVSIDETCLSTGEVYTIVSNQDANARDEHRLMMKELVKNDGWSVGFLISKQPFRLHTL